MNDAVLSPCGRYRYLLTRRLSEPAHSRHKICAFIMLNPSTADALTDDPTIRRCVGFARRWGCAELRVANIFGFRATNPADLRASADPVGPENFKYLCDAIDTADVVVLACGRWDKHPLTKTLVSQITASTPVLYCLGKNKDGSPKHPLFLRGKTELTRF